ncbi:MAG: substrate-binding domain-containing protein [Phycisphaerae bacterium]|nr:substrate-binding domain-containing protein [Phycisphaerae bacterium]
MSSLLRASFARAAALVAAVALAATASSSAQPPAPKKKTYVFGVIAKSASNPVFVAARTGANDAAKAIGKEMGVEIKIDWRTPNNEDAQRQADYVEQLSASADGIAVSCTDAKTLKSAINSAVDKGVPVVCFDSDAADSKRFAYFGTDDLACGKQVAVELAKAMGEKGVVAILAGNQTAPNLQKRVAGVKEGLAAFKDIKVLDTYYHRETPQDAVAKMEEVQRTNPQVTGWALVGGWPLNTENALGNIAGKAKVVSVDALRPMLSYVRNGQVDVLLGQQVYEWGYESVRLLANKVIAGKSPTDPIVKADLVRVTKENVDEYARNWEKWAPESGKR